MTRKSVQGGHCTYPDDENCALERQGCNDSTNFLSSREMQNGPGMAHGGSCRWQDSVKDTKLGKCNSSNVSSENSNNNENNNNDYSEGDDYYHCSPNAESCQSESESAFTTTFISNNNGNNSNDNCMVENTFFGRCNSDLRCAWSPKDCDDNENDDNNDVSHIDNKSNNDFWTFPMIDCTCDNVQVGACSNKDADLATIATEEIFCAVSPDGCDGMQTWIRPTEVISVAGFDCYLCRETSTTIITTTAPPAISTTDTDTDTDTDTTDNSNSSSSSSNSSSNNMNDNDYNINNNNSGLITGVVLGTVVILSIVGFVGWKLVNNRNRSCTSTSNRGGGGGAVVADNDGFVYGYGFGKEQSSNEPPTTAVELSSESYGSGNDKHAHQRTKMDLGDNVSVLSDDE